MKAQIAPWGRWKKTTQGPKNNQTIIPGLKCAGQKVTTRQIEEDHEDEENTMPRSPFSRARGVTQKRFTTTRTPSSKPNGRAL